MFEEYLQDAHEFFSIASKFASDKSEREAKRYFRGAVFYTSGAMEAFVNYLADSFAKGRSIPDYEICFLNDKVLIFTPQKGLHKRQKYNSLDEKIKLILQRFVPKFDFTAQTWIRFMEFKSFRDSLVHPRQADDELPLKDYDKRIKLGLKATIEIMNEVSSGVFRKPLRKQIMDLIPE